MVWPAEKETDECPIRSLSRDSYGNTHRSRSRSAISLMLLRACCGLIPVSYHAKQILLALCFQST